MEIYNNKGGIMNLISFRNIISSIKSFLFFTTILIVEGCGSENAYESVAGQVIIGNASGGLEFKDLMVTQQEMNFYVKGAIKNVSSADPDIKGEIVIKILSKEGEEIAETGDCFRYKNVRFGPRLDQKYNREKLRFQTRLPFLPSTEETIIVTLNLQNQRCS